MTSRAILRLRDMNDSIAQIHALLKDRSAVDLDSDRVCRAAFERFLEILSEASRHVPEEWRGAHPEISWREIAGLGNHLRHAYHKIDRDILWNVYEHELGALETVVTALLAKHS